MHVHDVNERKPRFTVRRVFLPARGVESFTIIGPDLRPVELVGYEEWLDRQALSSASRRAYLRAVKAFVAFLAASDVRGDPLGDRMASAHALRDFKRERLRARAAPATVNLELAAIDTLYRSRGIDPPVVERLELGTLAPRALARREQIEVLRAVERRGSARDAAIAGVLSYTAVRVSECAALDVEDVSLTARTGEVVVRRARRVPTGPVEPCCS